MSTGTAHAMLQLTVLVWGFTAILGKQITLNAPSLVFYRTCIAAVVVGLYMLVRKRNLAIPRRLSAQVIGVGALVAFHWVCFYACIKLAGVAVAVLCLSSVALVTALIEPIIYKRPLRLPEVGAGLLVLAGVSLLVKVETDASGTALALGIAAAVVSSLFGTLNGRLRRELPSDAMALWELSAAAAWMGVAFVLAPDQLVVPSAVGGDDWMWLAILGIVCTALPWLWSLDVVAVLTPYTVALGVTLEPVYSMIIAYFWFPGCERLSLEFYLGAALLLALVMVNAVMRARAAP